MEIEKRDKSPRSSHKTIGCYPVLQVVNTDPIATTHDKKCSRKYSHSFSKHQSPEWMPRRYSIENSLLSRQQQHQHTNHQQLPNCCNEYIGLGSRLESLNVGTIAVDRERELNLIGGKSCSMKKLAQGFANRTNPTCSMRNELKKSLDDDEDDDQDVEDDSGGDGARSGVSNHDETGRQDKDQSPSITTDDVKNNHRAETSNSPFNQGNQHARLPNNEVEASAAKVVPSSPCSRTPTVDVLAGSRVSDSGRADKKLQLLRESKAMPSAIKEQRSGRQASTAATTVCDQHNHRWLSGSTMNMSLSDCTTDSESPTCCSYSNAEPTTAKPTAVSAMYNEQNKKIDLTIEDSFTMSVSEKLQMQDRHRKQVIISMALKQVIAGEHGTISLEECGCRSRSRSFGPARSPSKTTAAVAATSAAAAPTPSPSSSSTVMPGHSNLFGERGSDTIKRLQISEKFPESPSSSIVLDNLSENPLDQFMKLNQSIGENIVLKQGAKTRRLNITNKTLDEICQLQLQAYKQQQIQQRQFHARHSTGESPARQLNLMRHLITGDLTGRRDQLNEPIDSNENSQWIGRNLSPMGSCRDNCELAQNLSGTERSKSSIADSWSKLSQVQDSGESHQQQQPSLITRRSCSAFGNKNNNNNSNSHLNSKHTPDLDQCETSLEALIVESWLDDHPQFTHDYFIRKAPRQLVDDWLIANARVSNTNPSSQLDLRSISNISRPMSQISSNSHLRGSSWRGSESIVTTNDAFEENDSQSPQFGQFIRPTRSNSQSAAGMASIRAQSSITPIRKISATDFETRTGSGFLRPMLSKTPDGRLTFLPQPTNSVTSRPPSTTSESIPAVIKPLTHRQDQQQQHQETTLRVTKKHDSNQSSIKLNLSNLAPISQGVKQEDGNSDLSSLIDDNDDNSSSSSSSNSTINSKTRADTMRRHESGSDDDEQSPDSDSTDSPSHDKGEVKMIFELVKNIYDDLDIRTLLHKILKNIAVLINADRSSLFLVCGGPNDLNRRLVSQLFNVDQDSTEVGEPDESITIPWGTGLVGYVAESGEAVNITDCYKDPRFTDAIDQRTGYLTRHMLCAPILDKRNEIVGVAQVINKRDGNPFSKNDEMKFKRYLQFCGIGLRNAQSYEQCQLENRRNQVLLDLARMVFEEQSTIEQVVHRIMLHTQSLLGCERCQVLLIDSGSDEHESLLQMPPASARCNNTGATSATTTDENGASRSGAETTCIKQTDWRPQCSQFNMTLTAEDYRDEQASAECGAPTVPDVTRESDSKVKTNADVANDSDYHDQSKQKRQKKQSPRLFSLVFDLECDGNEDPVVYDSRRSGLTVTDGGSGSCGGPSGPKKARAFPINIGITGYVATTGETLNIKNAHEHERFDPSVDEGSDFKHESILCMPIRNGQRQIIGVSQLINKKNGQPFNKNDEDLFEAFAIFCGLGIHNTLIYERVLKVMAKQRVTFEVLSYHATAPLEEAKKLSQEQIPSCFALNLASLKFNDFSLDDQYMLKSCLRFFLDLDLIRRFQIDQLVFCNWILSVQKNYRKVTYHPIVGGNGLKASPVRYHNWRHAFNVSQMMFAILVNTQICQSLGELETLALLIACLCHDLDHRGTNNSFQIKSASPLAELYSTSTMEHHHFDQCVMILNSQGNQILSNLSPEEYSRVIILLEEAILATDLANYFAKRDHFFQLVNSNRFDWRNDLSHRSLLRCMLMTACDVAAITKPWPVQKVVADLVMSEFYQQGDIEKNELKIQPIDMMNRDKMSELPSMQIGFIDSICAPIYTAFARLFPHELASLLDGCLTNRNLWQQLADSNTRPNIPLINYLVCDNDETRRDVGAAAATRTPSINVSFSKSEANIPKQLTIESDNTKKAKSSSFSDEYNDSELCHSNIELPYASGYLIGLSDTTELYHSTKINSVRHESQRKSF